MLILISFHSSLMQVTHYFLEKRQNRLNYPCCGTTVCRIHNHLDSMCTFHCDSGMPVQNGVVRASAAKLSSRRIDEGEPELDKQD